MKRKMKRMRARKAGRLRVNELQDLQHGGFTEGFAVEYLLIGIIAGLAVYQ